MQLKAGDYGGAAVHELLLFLVVRTELFLQEKPRRETTVLMKGNKKPRAVAESVSSAGRAVRKDVGAGTCMVQTYIPVFICSG